MRIRAIACEVMARTLYREAALAPHVIDVELLEQALHDDRPASRLSRLQSQIDATQSNLDRELSNVSNNSNAELVAARQLEAKLRVAVEEQRAKVLGVNKLEDEGMKYELELESAQSVYKRALDGYDQIMFASGAHVANISVVSSAIPPQKAAKPNKVKLLLAGIFLGIVAGLLGLQSVFYRGPAGGGKG